MPWNDNSDDKDGKDGSGKGPGSPWGRPSGGGNGSGPGGPGGNPWGQGGGRKPTESGNLDDLARRVEDRLKVVLGGKGNASPPGGPRSGGGGGGGRELTLDRRSIGALVLVGFLGWLATGVYVVDTGEQGIVTRFGKFVRVTEPGLQLRLPSPIEAHVSVPVQAIQTLEVGSAGGAENTSGLMLTADENIVDVGFNVLWRVQDPGAFLFNVAHGPTNRDGADSTVIAVAESAMREVVGRAQREQVLTTGRAQVETQTRDLMQRMLNQYRTGILITQVNLTRAEPPAGVIDAFRQVAAASQEAETKINEARTYQNQVVPQARGEADRFNQLYQEYRLAPEVTRQRLYIETMERVYGGANRVLIDPGRGGQAPVVVLPPEMLRGALGSGNGNVVSPPQSQTRAEAPR
jgi:modulator of FtsH protease HflK